jgi:putative membrane protein
MDFMVRAAQVSRAQIEMARPVEHRSANARVRDYALSMVHEHMRVLADLFDLAAPQDIREPSMLPVDDVKQINRLASLSGDEFDREYINTMVENHKRAIEMFRSQSGTQNPEIRQYIDTTLPVLQKNLREAHELQSALFSGKPK